MKRGKTVDFTIILIWPIVASLLSFLFKANFIVATLLFLVLPSIYISLRDKKSVARAAIFSLAAMPFLFVLEYFAVKSGAWYFTKTIFSTRIFDTIIPEVLLWYFFWVYLVIIYYEYFIDYDKHPKLYGHKLKYPFFIFIALVISTIFLAIYKVSVSIPYFYLIIGIIMAVIPVALALFDFPKLFTKFTKVTIYFFYLYLVIDLTEIALGHWIYPGKFIGWFEMFGQKLPVEELFAWIILGAAALLSWYELFDDDKK